MPVTSTIPTSRRRYLSQDELEQYANITITDSDEADDVISQAEEMIDSYVGFQEKFLPNEITGLAPAGSSTTITLETSQQNVYDVNYFKLCDVEIIGGTGEGQRRTCVSSTLAGVLTLDSAWTTTPDSTSFYKITQFGKFPRRSDVISYSLQNPVTYYKTIPEAVRRAVAAQVEFIIEMGDEYFAGNQTTLQSETIGDYSYTNEAGSSEQSESESLIAPKAKILLKGYIKRSGQIVL